MKRIIPENEIPPDVLTKAETWQQKRRSFEPAVHSAELYAIFQAILQVPEEEWNQQQSLRKILIHFPKDGKGFYSKTDLIRGYRHLVAEGDIEPDPLIMKRIRMKPVRTASGVAPVTVLTAPAGCPGKCIFCPDDWRMPKSYIYDEPGCQRAERDGFDPYKQTLGRIQSFESIGHEANKVELLILGGTWSAYSRDYREWFIQRCLEAMNQAGNRAIAVGSDPDDHVEKIAAKASELNIDAKMKNGAGANSTLNSASELSESEDSSIKRQSETTKSLAVAQQINTTAVHRNVGLVIETRPDWVTPEEIRHLRQLGVTKVQIGVQSLDDEILALNERGHDVDSVRQALGLLRTAGFKLHLHWMPNLFGATPEKDRADFERFFADPAICPDELKIYPCSLIKDTELYTRWQAGEYYPYTEKELVELLVQIKPTIRPYTRVNRLFRDIPAHHIEAGVKLSNLREVVHEELARRGQKCGCIRCREVKRRQIKRDELELQVYRYATDLTQEHFLQFVTNRQSEQPGLIAGFLRLSLPNEPLVGSRQFLPEITESAMIREVHVYGPALSLGSEKAGAAQHVGLGTQLIDEARHISRSLGFRHISVIAAIGTQQYYAERGFRMGELYMNANL
ncbi:tRNA uridine(34) 5-carboxymethylaminomethyl modification radical SAM/GNAT enzyme Elp3 [Chloroflexi bacterium TSY]|nr:tRNA uridine(34) 5-carboxymethylaminomethyl modification radical SAM/GNAT enzyme Elp3 [Chloroflexi bacterium TSY]